MDLKKNFWLNDSHDDCKKPKVNQEKLYNSIPVHSKEPKFEKILEFQSKRVSNLTSNKRQNSDGDNSNIKRVKTNHINYRAEYDNKMVDDIKTSEYTNQGSHHFSNSIEFNNYQQSNRSNIEIGSGVKVAHNMQLKTLYNKDHQITNPVLWTTYRTSGHFGLSGVKEASNSDKMEFDDDEEEKENPSSINTFQDLDGDCEWNEFQELFDLDLSFLKII